MGVNRVILVGDVEDQVVVFVDNMIDICSIKYYVVVKLFYVRVSKVYVIFIYGIFFGLVIFRIYNVFFEVVGVINIIF